MEKVNQGRLFFSNHLEALLICLEKNLFIEDDPFAEKIVVVPSKEMGKWIRQKLAERLGIAAHIQTLFLYEALKIALPSKLDLSIKIYEQIGDLKYVQNDIRKRVVLAQTLASFFQRYAIYGVNFQEDWQKKLWDNVFPSLNFKIPNKVFHFFSFSHIPQKLFHLLGNSLFYHLSPSYHYWSDFKKNEDHLLLSNLGKVGREFAKMAEESPLERHDLYIQPQCNSALHQFQRSMLDLYETKIEGDESTMIHVVSSKHQEIEVLYHELLKLDVEPKDVIVMAPDITLYVPYIKAIFSHFRITDMPPSLNEEVRGLDLLLNLEKKRWGVLTLFELFTHPLFYRQWKEEEMEWIRKWVQKSGIRWGYKGSEVSWEKGFERLLDDLALAKEPLVTYTDAQLLGELIETVRLLYQSLDYQGRTLSEWADYVRFLMETFFIESSWLLSKLEPFRRGESIPFEAFYLLLQEELKKEGLTINPNQLQSYHFCSMLPMRSIPAKVIWLLGMDQESFPRLDRKLSFDLPLQSYSPTRLDFDRCLFLESVLSAREKFVISYIGRDPLDNQERSPSTVVSDFLKHVHIEPVVHKNCVAQRESILAPFALHLEEANTQEAVVEIADLLSLAKSPLKHYYKHQLGMHFWKEESLKEEEEFLISPFTLSYLRKAALQNKLAQGIERVKREGGYPFGIFKQVANRRISEIQEIQTNTYEFHLHVQEKRQIEEHLFHLPALKIASTKLVGKIEGIVDDTLYLPAKKDVRAVLSAWPLILIFAHLGNEVVFLRDDQKMPIPFAKAALEGFLRYFFLSKKVASPFYPTWIRPILLADKKNLEKEIYAPTFDLPLSWSCSGRVFDLDRLIEVWQPKAKELYQEVFDAWF